MLNPTCHSSNLNFFLLNAQFTKDPHLMKNRITLGNFSVYLFCAFLISTVYRNYL